MWLVLATAITVATPTGATLDSSQVIYTATTATLTLTLSSTDAAAHVAEMMIDVPREARAIVMTATIGGVRSEAKLELVKKTRTAQQLKLSVRPIAKGMPVTVTITIDLTGRARGYVSSLTSLIAVEPERVPVSRIQRVLAEPTYCGVGR